MGISPPTSPCGFLDKNGKEKKVGEEDFLYVF